jgi:hypothetical protein
VKTTDVKLATIVCDGGKVLEVYGPPEKRETAAKDIGAKWAEFGRAVLGPDYTVVTPAQSQGG